MCLPYILFVFALGGIAFSLQYLIVQRKRKLNQTLSFECREFDLSMTDMERSLILTIVTAASQLVHIKNRQEHSAYGTNTFEKPRFPKSFEDCTSIFWVIWPETVV
jgi:hypothetical protein